MVNEAWIELSTISNLLSALLLDMTIEYKSHPLHDRIELENSAHVMESVYHRQVLLAISLFHGK